MRNNLYIKLGVGILAVVVVAVAFVCVLCYEPFMFRMHEKNLFLKNEKKHKAAFEFLASRGNRGREVIRKFCIEHTEVGWGPEGDGVQIRLTPEIYIIEKPFKYVWIRSRIKTDDPNKQKQYINDNSLWVRVEIRNVSKQDVKVPSKNGKYDPNWWGHPKIFRYSGSGHGIMCHPAYRPEEYLDLKPGNTFSGHMNISSQLSGFEPGIWFFNTCQERGPWTTTNTICIAIMPEGR